jgi:membrane protein
MNAWTILKSTASDFSEDECMSSGAALAYYTIFSLPPLLAIVFAIASGLGVSQEKIDTVVFEQLGMPSVAMTESDTSETASSADPQANGNDSASTASQHGLSEIAGNAQMQREGSMFSRIASIVLLIFSATGLLAQLQVSLNRAWEVEPDPDQSGIKNFAIKRVLSFGMIVVVAFLLLVAMVITTLIDEILGWISSGVPGTVQIVLAHTLNAASTIAIATLLFAAMYKILPDAKVQWKDVAVGALVTSVLFVIGKTLIGLYLSSSDVGSGWGAAAGSLVSILVWVYYTALIVLLGAEFTQVWAKSRGREIEPVAGAVRKIEEKRIIRESAGTASAG